MIIEYAFSCYPGILVTFSLMGQKKILNQGASFQLKTLD